MKHDSSHNLGQRLARTQENAAHHPLWHRLRIVLFVLLGYGCLLFLGAVVVALAAALCLMGYSIATRHENGHFAVAVFWMAVPMLVYVVYGAMKAMQSNISPRSALILRPPDSQELFDLIEKTRHKLRSKRIHRVFLTEEFGASLVLVPRLGGFAGSKRYLYIGLPLMQALPPKLFAAALAHELAHESGRLNRFTRWLHHFNNHWVIINHAARDAGPVARALVGWFASWYVPRLRTVLFSMLRDTEYEADRLAAKVTGTDVFAQMLLATHVKNHFVQQLFWPRIQRMTSTHAQPPEDIFGELGRELATQPTPSFAVGWLSWSLKRLPDYREIHPTLSQRLLSIGYLEIIPEDTGSIGSLLPSIEGANAAKFFFDEALPELTYVLSMRWRNAGLPRWRDEYQYSTMRQSYIHDLRKRMEQEGILPDGEHWLLCRLVEEFDGRRAAYPHYREYLEDHREDARANFAFGRLLVEENDERGLPYVDYAMQADAGLIEDGCRLICDYLYRQDRHGEAHEYEVRAAKHRIEHALEIDERRTVDRDDVFVSAGLDDTLREQMAAKLALLDDVRRAYAVNKQIAGTGDSVMVIALQLKRGRAWTREMRAAFQQWLDLPQEILVVTRRDITKRLKTIPGALVYERRAPQKKVVAPALVKERA